MTPTTKHHHRTAGLCPGPASRPGRSTFIVKVPLPKSQPLSIPVHVLRGRRSGPTLLVVAGEHGTEINGIAAVDRVFRETDPQTLRGTFVGIPAANPANVYRRGFVAGPYAGPWDTFAAWPGDRHGTPAERITAALTAAVLEQVDAVINIHAWSWYSASCVFAACNSRSMQLARAFGLEFVCFRFSNYCRGADVKLHPKHNQLTHYAQAHGKPAMLVELRTHHWLYPPSVAAGITGIRNVMQTLGMLPGKPVPPPVQYEALDEQIVHAPRPGLFVPVRNLADRVRRNEILGYLLDLKTGRQTKVTSPCPGALWLIGRVGKPTGMSLPEMHAYANRGDMLALIKRVRAH